MKELKNLWQNPQYQALIKLLLWAIFFIILILLMRLSPKLDDGEKKEVETPKITYKEIKNKFVSSKLEIEYQVNEEEGKLIYQDNTLYSSQTSNLNEEYLNPAKLINLLDANEYILKVKDEEKVYIYDINETKIEVSTKEDKITKVTIVGATDTYNITYKY